MLLNRSLRPVQLFQHFQPERPLPTTVVNLATLALQPGSPAARRMVAGIMLLLGSRLWYLDLLRATDAERREYKRA